MKNYIGKRYSTMAQVYFASARTYHASDALYKAIPKLFEKVCNIEKNEKVAIKLHMGELGNTNYIRPIFIKKIVEMVEKEGGMPFVTDTTALYGGKRGNAIDYLHTAAINGFSISSMNAPVIIADGLLGFDGKGIDINGNKIEIALAILQADKLIVTSHFKGHGMAGFGGAIKNLGMGCSTKNGKIWQHEVSKPVYDSKNCILCKKCVDFCPANAIKVDDKVIIDYAACFGCGACTVLCDQGCFYLPAEKAEEFQERVAIAAKAAVNNVKGVAYFNFVMNVTPRCDCCSFADTPIVQDVGILASNDPVAIDKASFDLVNALPGMPNSLGEGIEKGIDKFYKIHGIDGTVQLRKAEEIGLGSMEYKIIEI